MSKVAEGVTAPASPPPVEDQTVTPVPAAPPPYRGSGEVLVWRGTKHQTHKVDDLVRADPETAAELVSSRKARRATDADLNGPKPIAPYAG